MKRLLALSLLATSIFAPAMAIAQQGDATTVDALTVAASPLSAADVPEGQAPYASERVTSDDLTRTGAPSVLRALSETSGQIQLNHAQSNPFQPNVSYRGFDASPLVGNAQGLAVYVDGVRFNMAFGDTVNWDLIPDAAVSSITVEGANPVFGLNALGGSLDVRLKTGKEVDGFGGEATVGAFGRRDVFAEYGRQSGNSDIYIGVRGLEEDGWRDFSPSSLLQAYAGVGIEGENTDWRFQLVAADNDLTGNGTSPVELLEVDREAVFTHPDNTRNRFMRFSASVDHALSDTSSVQAQVYLQTLRQRTMNGDAADVEECDSPFDGFVCSEEDPGEPLEDADGDEIPDFLGGEDYAFLNRGSTDTDAFGATVQMRRHAGSHRLLAGLSLDAGASTFRASSELGALTEERGYEGPGVIVESDEIGSIGVRAHNRYYGLFVSDRIEISPELTLTLSGRYNKADVTLRDLIGTELTGEHSFSRFNPAIGVAWKASESLSVFGGYSEANRAPTPAELSCADPAAPCSLTNFFVGDPPLKQVVSRTFEGGMRGGSKPWRWSATAYSTRTEDDIMFIASPTVGRAYFQNVGETQRQGAQADISYEEGAWFFSASVALTEATFQTPLTLNAPENPEADGDGHIFVTPGDTIPGVARSKVKLVADYEISDRWRVGASALIQSGQYLFGDESNENEKTDGFTVVNLSTSFALTPKVSLVASVENLFDTEYETFGTFSPVDEVPLDELPGGIADNPRALSPGSPQAVYVGLRGRF